MKIRRQMLAILLSAAMTLASAGPAMASDEFSDGAALDIQVPDSVEDVFGSGESEEAGDPAAQITETPSQDETAVEVPEESGQDIVVVEEPSEPETDVFVPADSGEEIVIADSPEEEQPSEQMSPVDQEISEEIPAEAPAEDVIVMEDPAFAETEDLYGEDTITIVDETGFSVLPVYNEAGTLTAVRLVWTGEDPRCYVWDAAAGRWHQLNPADETAEIPFGDSGLYTMAQKEDGTPLVWNLETSGTDGAMPLPGYRWNSDGQAYEYYLGPEDVLEIDGLPENVPAEIFVGVKGDIAAHSGLQEIEGNLCYLNEDGTLFKNGELEVNGQIYRFDQDGRYVQDTAEASTFYDGQTFLGGAPANNVTVSKQEIQELGASKAIQNALDAAKEAAVSVITVAPGSYTLTSSLRIYSNTTLVLDGVTLKRVDANKNMIRVGDIDGANTGKTGYYYKNITLRGGTLDGNRLMGTMVKVGHTENFTMQNMVLKNAYNSHTMETGGVKNVTIQGCEFRDQVLTETSLVDCYEAIQLDILSAFHLPEYRTEDLPTVNVTIDNCKFINVPRGVGSHTGIYNNPMREIHITNCYFQNTSSAAIQTLNWVDSIISGNEISDCRQGIGVYSMWQNGAGIMTPSALQKEGGVKSGTSSKFKVWPTNIQITNNNIKLNNTVSLDYEKVGIRVEGVPVAASPIGSEGSGGIPTGDYYASKVTVSGNTIGTVSNKNGYGIGIKFVDTRNSVIENNTVSLRVLGTKANHGIQLRDKSLKNNIIGNTLVNIDGTGIYVNVNSSANKIDSNKITNAVLYGISVEPGSVAGNITNNTIKTAGINGIFISSQSAKTVSVTKIDGNAVSNVKYYGIAVQNAQVKNITNNTVNKADINGIFISNTTVKNLTVSSIASNTVSNTKKYGIGIQTAKVGSINGNTVSATGDVGINIGMKSLVTYVNSNDVTGTGSHAILVSSASVASYMLNNIISNAKGCGIAYSGGSVGVNVSGNTVTGTTSEPVFKDGVSKVTSIANTYSVGVPKVTVSNAAAGITLKWNKVAEANKYFVFRKTSGGKYSVIASLNGNVTSYTDKKAQHGVMYVYAVRAYNNKLGYGTFLDHTIYRLNRPAVSSVTNTAGKKLVVKWKKNNKVTGYQIRYTTGKTVKTRNVAKKGTVKLTLTNLKKASYKVEMRYYYKKAGVTYYSAWSPAKNVKITK